MIAGEASGDLLAADLIKSLKYRYPNAKFVGIGGPKMISEGFETLFPMEKLSVMGIFEVIKHLPELLKIRKKVINSLLKIKPDAFIGIDAPDFNFKVEEVLKKHSIKTIHYVGPSVWAWREKRLNKIKQQVDGVLVLFPFETPYYDKYDIPVKFVGHPLANKIPEKPNKTHVRAQLGLPVDASITGLMPGSRMAEINAMADVYIQAATILAQIYPEMIFVVPCVHDRAKQRMQQAVSAFGEGLKVYLFDRQADKVIEASDQLIVTSGTATLEVALYKKPLVLSIKVHPISYWIMKALATTQWIGLPNILAKETLVPELIQEQAIPENIAQALGALISTPSLRKKQIQAFEQQYIQLKQNASELAADAIEEWSGLQRER
ncbi:lipid-A-disaccharide synthase [Hydrogenovibrio kuenenii]|uniref:lipid-A-disaccharide synthase n=1 Tax=Hydrogenovibrio kuenenii TaxID=63658 RepID=UPI000466CC10|nr:lipid-A-disaccharide synthase [Hydrogenovibrio kuenenii]